MKKTPKPYKKKGSKEKRRNRGGAQAPTLKAEKRKKVKKQAIPKEKKRKLGKPPGENKKRGKALRKNHLEKAGQVWSKKKKCN